MRHPLWRLPHFFMDTILKYGTQFARTEDKQMNSYLLNSSRKALYPLYLASTSGQLTFVQNAVI